MKISPKKIRNFSNSRWRTDAILKIVFGYISARYWAINAKFGKEMKNHVTKQWNRCKFPFEAWKFDKKIDIFQFKTADGRYIENRFLAISRRHIGRLMHLSELRWRITCRYRSHDKNGNFRKFKMADGRRFENSFISISQSRIIRFRSDLICRCKFPFRSDFFQIQNGGRPPYWKSSFGYISTNDYPINAKLCRIKQNHVLTQVIWPNYQISKTQDGGRPSFENGFIAISQPEIIRYKWNSVCWCRLCFQGRLLNKILKFCKFKMADVFQKLRNRTPWKFNTKLGT